MQPLLKLCNYAVVRLTPSVMGNTLWFPLERKPKLFGHGRHSATRHLGMMACVPKLEFSSRGPCEDPAKKQKAALAAPAQAVTACCLAGRSPHPLKNS